MQISRLIRNPQTFQKPLEIPKQSLASSMESHIRGAEKFLEDLGTIIELLEKVPNAKQDQLAEAKRELTSIEFVRNFRAGLGYRLVSNEEGKVAALCFKLPRDEELALKGFCKTIKTLMKYSYINTTELDPEFKINKFHPLPLISIASIIKGYLGYSSNYPLPKESEFTSRQNLFRKINEKVKILERAFGTPRGAVIENNERIVPDDGEDDIMGGYVFNQDILDIALGHNERSHANLYLQTWFLRLVGNIEAQYVDNPLEGYRLIRELCFHFIKPEDAPPLDSNLAL